MALCWNIFNERKEHIVTIVMSKKEERKKKWKWLSRLRVLSGEFISILCRFLCNHVLTLCKITVWMKSAYFQDSPNRINLTFFSSYYTFFALFRFSPAKYSIQNICCACFSFWGNSCWLAERNHDLFAVGILDWIINTSGYVLRVLSFVVATPSAIVLLLCCVSIWRHLSIRLCGFPYIFIYFHANWKL